jgi:hypothetical protein
VNGMGAIRPGVSCFGRLDPRNQDQKGMGDDSLLARMMRSTGWGPEDLERLYLSYGFDKQEGAKHTVYTHQADLVNLRATVARHSNLPKGYTQTAIRLIRLLAEIEGRNDESNA